MFGFFRKADPRKSLPVDRRQHERYTAAMLSSPLGKVVDLSVSGMSLMTERKPTLRQGQSGAFPITVGSKTFNLYGRVLRVRRKALKQYEIGVAFINADPRVLHVLTSVARFGFVPKDGVVEDAPREPMKHDIDMAAQTGAIDRDPAGLYRLLGVTPDASEPQINEAFRQMARQYHPDLNRATDAQEHFIAIKQAHDVLRDPARRERYDRTGLAALPSAAREHATET